MVSVDRIQGLSGSLAVKAPCRVATTAAITLSGEQTIDGVAVVDGDRVLVKNQSSAIDNGIYVASTGTWTRALDCDGANDIANGTLIVVAEGATDARMYEVSCVEPAIVGTSALEMAAATSFAEITAYPGVAAGTRFVFVGDSKTDGPTDPTAYPYYFSQLATSAALGTVYNLGVSGYTLANLISNYTANVKPYAPGQANNLTNIPTVLSIWIGANDLYQLVSNGYADAAAYYTALSNYIATAIADGFQIMLFTVDARGDHADATTEFYRAGVNAAIRHNTQATWIVDPESVFWDYTDTTWWNADMIHYVAAGYERLAKLVAQTLLSGGAPGDLNSPKVNKTNTWSKPQAMTGGDTYQSGAAGTTRGFFWMTALIARFYAYLTATAESGSNAGSDFAIARYDDSGVVLNALALLWNRATGLLTISDRVKFTGGFGTGAPVTVTDAAYTVLASDYSIIANRAGTVTLTLPSAATYSGRILRVRTITANTVVSAASDVVPLAGGAAGTAILAATAGKWADLQSDGTNWQIMAGA